MKHELDFRQYLTEVRKSAKTHRAYSPKVITDILRRCRTAEALLQIELTPVQMKRPAELDRICKSIRDNRLSSTDRMPYAHLSLINAVRIYSDFCEWKARSS